MAYIKSGIFLFSMVAASFFGWRYYSTASSLSVPTLEILGLESGDCGISKDREVVVKAYDKSKIDTLQIALDGEVLHSSGSVGKKSIEFPLTLVVKQLKNGPHELSAVMVSLDKEVPKTTIKRNFHCDTLPLQATLTKNGLDARVYQGHTLHVEFQANKEIKSALLKTLSESYPCYLQSNRGFVYECFVPIECEELPQEHPYTIEITDWAGNSIYLEGKFEVMPFPFKKQALRVDKKKIEEENSLGRPEKELEDEIVELTKKSPQKKLWHGRFIVPLELKDPTQITSDFGVIRATQERGLSQHKALDLIALPKSVVWATQDGIIVIKERYVHSGNTIAIDHGYGLMSLFFHLDEFADGKVGDPIKKGKPIGTVGKTGYATGYHLHWEMRVNTVPVEPLEWTKSSF